nr:hypothetical protein TetV2_00304 [Oceanusvirus sp.]
MDLICDRILRQLENDKKRETVEVQVALRSIPDDVINKLVDARTTTTHSIEFNPVYIKDAHDDCPYILSVSGVRFFPKKEVVKSFVSFWLDDMAALSRDNKLNCEMKLTAKTGDTDIYNNNLRFQYFPEHCTKNRRAINRVVERVMHVKGLCENMRA